MKRPQAVVVPFYIKLYDEVAPTTRDAFVPFLDKVAAALTAQGIDITVAPICCVAAEFDAVVKEAEVSGADCLITLHLAYSPSLESLAAFQRTSLPVVILDTTMDSEFGLAVSPSRIMFNHGIHGVMDFASMLRRVKRPFEIVAGAVDAPEFFARAGSLVKAATAARLLRRSKVVRIGQAFVGMGDFAVAPVILQSKLGIVETQVGLEAIEAEIATLTDANIAAEIAADQQHYDCQLPADVHQRSVRVGLGLRRLLERGGYDGFSINFQSFETGERPANTMPFLEISKAMARGIGYGGEGDILTAALVGALARAFGAVTFTEIFCADWNNNALFLAHMGEISPSVAADKPLIFEKPFVFGGAKNPAVLTCAARPGPAVFVNLTPGPDDTFSLIVAPVKVLAEAGKIDPEMRKNVRIWIEVEGDVGDFLERYSRAGGTHHSALVLGDHAEALLSFARLVGIEGVRL